MKNQRTVLTSGAAQQLEPGMGIERRVLKAPVRQALPGRVTPWPQRNLYGNPRKAGIISDPQFKRSHAITLKAMVQLFGCLPQSSNMIKAKVSVLAPTDYRIVTAWHGGN